MNYIIYLSKLFSMVSIRVTIVISLLALPSRFTLGFLIGADAKTQFYAMTIFLIAALIPIVSLTASVFALNFIDENNRIHLLTTPFFIVVFVFMIISRARWTLLGMILYPFRLLWNAL